MDTGSFGGAASFTRRPGLTGNAWPARVRRMSSVRRRAGRVTRCESAATGNPVAIRAVGRFRWRREINSDLSATGETPMAGHDINRDSARSVPPPALRVLRHGAGRLRVLGRGPVVDARVL